MLVNWRNLILAMGAAVFAAMALAASASALEATPSDCTEAGGETFGRSGEAYQGGCSLESERGFLSGYIVGRRVFSAEYYLKRARREFEQASKHGRAAIDYHAGKASEALSIIDDPQSSASKRSTAAKDLKMHRDQILLIEEELDWISDRSWDAHLHVDQVTAELDGWRNGEIHAFLLEQFVEAQVFARSEEAIEFCSDEPDTAFFVPGLYCLVRNGGTLIDTATGKICGAGASRITLVRRGASEGEFEPAAAYLHSFNAARRAENGKVERTGGVLTFFGREGGYLGARCPDPEEWN